MIGTRTMVPGPVPMGGTMRMPGSMVMTQPMRCPPPVVTTGPIMTGGAMYPGSMRIDSPGSPPALITTQQWAPTGSVRIDLPGTYKMPVGRSPSSGFSTPTRRQQDFQDFTPPPQAPPLQEMPVGPQVKPRVKRESSDDQVEREAAVARERSRSLVVDDEEKEYEEQLERERQAHLRRMRELEGDDDKKEPEASRWAVPPQDEELPRSSSPPPQMVQAIPTEYRKVRQLTEEEFREENNFDYRGNPPQNMMYNSQPFDTQSQAGSMMGAPTMRFPTNNQVSITTGPYAVNNAARYQSAPGGFVGTMQRPLVGGSIQMPVSSGSITFSSVPGPVPAPIPMGGSLQFPVGTGSITVPPVMGGSLQVPVSGGSVSMSVTPMVAVPTGGSVTMSVVPRQNSVVIPPQVVMPAQRMVTAPVPGQAAQMPPWFTPGTQQRMVRPVGQETLNTRAPPQTADALAYEEEDEPEQTSFLGRLFGR